MEQFTFYEWYADILQSMDDISAGKLANCICAIFIGAISQVF